MPKNDLVCMYPGCRELREDCFWYCHAHHQAICMGGVTTQQQPPARTFAVWQEPDDPEDYEPAANVWNLRSDRIAAGVPAADGDNPLTGGTPCLTIPAPTHPPAARDRTPRLPICKLQTATPRLRMSGWHGSLQSCALALTSWRLRFVNVPKLGILDASTRIPQPLYTPGYEEETP